MFLIDLNQMYVKVSDGGRVRTHSLDDIEFMVPDKSPVHVRRGPRMAVMPMSVVHEWLWPFGPFDAHDDVYPAKYVCEVQKRRKPITDKSQPKGRPIFHSNSKILVISNSVDGLFLFTYLRG